MVNVYEKDAKNRIVAHAVTDIEGNFSMKIVDPNDVLIISHPEYAEAHRLLKFLRYFIPISDKEIPPTSIMREFVGGSSFKY